MARPATNEGLAAKLRAGTRELHRVAERSGIMRTLLQGRLDRWQYALLLRNLREIYATLEAAIARQGDAASAVSSLDAPLLARTAALDADLIALLGADATSALPIAEATSAYVARLREIERTQPRLLAAHAYVRYLGDLNGGRVLCDVVQKAFALDDVAGTRFYRFDGRHDELAENLRRGLDALPIDDADANAIVQEAHASFLRHIALFEELESLGAARARR
ncbi:MAG TPA: biliverdin-producing heme oxygenase [Rhodanobacteraceae bacterium]